MAASWVAQVFAGMSTPSHMPISPCNALPAPPPHGCQSTQRCFTRKRPTPCFVGSFRIGACIRSAGSGATRRHTSKGGKCHLFVRFGRRCRCYQTHSTCPAHCRHGLLDTDHDAMQPQRPPHHYVHFVELHPQQLNDANLGVNCPSACRFRIPQALSVTESEALPSTRRQPPSPCPPFTRVKCAQQALEGNVRGRALEVERPLEGTLYAYSLAQICERKR
mmetsp:Transcript_11750/g.24251  ORF Transcript_11750/g.24251 Transcript_11750/m.24251 type:complete len:220 (+) Transcript_11750:388-1047(+)